MDTFRQLHEHRFASALNNTQKWIVKASLSEYVEKNGCLAVKPKSIKLTYAETVRLKDSVEAQNCLIAKGGDPTTNDSILNVLSTNDQVKVDIKTK